MIVAARPASAAQAGAVPGPRSAPVTAIAEPITIDGVLDEPAWRSAPPIGELVQRQPDEGRGADRADRRSRCSRDRRQPLHRRRRLRPRADARPRHADGARRRASAPTIASRSCSTPSAISAARSTSPPIRPARWSTASFANGQLNTEWDAIWDVRTRRTDDGLDRRVRDSVQEPRAFPDDALGVGLQRRPPRSIASWKRTAGRAPASTRRSLQVSEAGEITSLGDLTPGHRPRRPAVPRRTLAAAGRATA